MRALILASGARSLGCAGRFLGLTVVERVVKNLQRAGVDELTILGASSLLPPGLRAQVRWREDPEHEPAAIRAVLAEAPTPLLVVAGDAVYHPDLPKRLVAAGKESACSLVAAETPGHPLLWLVPERPLPPGGTELAPWVAALRAEESLRPHELREGTDFVTPVHDPTAERRATKLLLKTNWRPHDGIVAKLLNKHISVAISARLANTPITPNQMTVAAFVVALVGVGLAGLGSHWAFALGAALVQLQSILDGCDGELARLRYQSSRFGAWLDTIVDDILGAGWLVALGLGGTRATGHWAYLAVGAGAAFLHVSAVVLIYIALFRGGAGGHQDFKWWWEEGEGQNPHTHEPDLRALSTWGKYALKRDFYVLAFFVLACFNLRAIPLGISAAGAVSWFVVMMVQIGKRGLRLVE
ncbi:MAG: NTP transferase domain-containing protein [Deltaproteobacteria bacterium]|nr:NTP transferase domain-containing protein [Deltaproteobacteria bacterium]